MKEYISKEYLYSILNPRLNDSRGAEHYAYDCIKQEIDYAPESEIIHMHEAKWIFDKEPYFNSFVSNVIFEDVAICSDCFDRVPAHLAGRQCPSCGAVMIKEGSNGRN